MIRQINGDASVHGCLIFRPLPKRFDDRRVQEALAPEKDVDGITDGSMAGVFTNMPIGYPPCTAQACLTLSNSRTRDLPALCREADVLVVAMGRRGAIGADCLREGQVVVDVGIHVNEEGKLCGDVRFDEAEPIVEAVTPVPGGVGTVTTSVLVGHVVDAASAQ